jgi:hypothetical protein
MGICRRIHPAGLPASTPPHVQVTPRPTSLHAIRPRLGLWRTFLAANSPASVIQHQRVRRLQAESHTEPSSGGAKHVALSTTGHAIVFGVGQRPPPVRPPIHEWLSAPLRPWSLALGVLSGQCGASSGPGRSAMASPRSSDGTWSERAPGRAPNLGRAGLGHPPVPLWPPGGRQRAISNSFPTSRCVVRLATAPGDRWVGPRRAGGGVASAR